MLIRLAETQEDRLRCMPAILALRPHLSEQAALKLLEQIETERGHLLMVEAGGMVPAIAVFRVNHYLLHGKDLYVDDLSTLAASRRKGYGSALLDWIRNYAVQQGCNTLRLDSGYDRHEAHRLYLQFGFQMAAHHFSMQLI